MHGRRVPAANLRVVSKALHAVIVGVPKRAMGCCGSAGALRTHDEFPLVRRGVDARSSCVVLDGVKQLDDVLAVAVVGVRSPRAAGRRILLDVHPNGAIRARPKSGIGK